MATLKALRERLNDLEQYERDELRSSKPSKAYLEDLTLTIEEVKRMIAQFEYAKHNPVTMVG